MPIEGILEEDEEGNRVIVLKESKKSMTKSEKKMIFLVKILTKNDPENDGVAQNSNHKYG